MVGYYLASKFQTLKLQAISQYKHWASGLSALREPATAENDKPNNSEPLLSDNTAFTALCAIYGLNRYAYIYIFQTPLEQTLHNAPPPNRFNVPLNLKPSKHK